jgi:hypothetical protein
LRIIPVQWVTCSNRVKGDPSCVGMTGLPCHSERSEESIQDTAVFGCRPGRALTGCASGGSLLRRDDRPSLSFRAEQESIQDTAGFECRPGQGSYRMHVKGDPSCVGMTGLPCHSERSEESIQDTAGFECRPGQGSYRMHVKGDPSCVGMTGHFCHSERSEESIQDTAVFGCRPGRSLTGCAS